MQMEGIIIGLLLCGIIVQFFLKRSGNSQDLLFLKEERGRLLGELTESRHKLDEANGALAGLRARNEAQQEKFAAQQLEMERLQERSGKEFELIASRILEEKTKKFTEVNRANLDLLLSPLKENIKAFEEKVEKAYKSESDERNVLKGEIAKLMELNKQISDEAGNLARALKSDSKKQGNWGEVILERILEASGLREGETYLRQASYMNGENARMQPDIVVLLPDKKQVIIDAKVSLVAYERLVNSESDEERQTHMRDHLSSLRTHVSALGSKNYQGLGGIDSPDFVLLFVPIESSFAVAVQNDHELFEYAWDRKVVLVTPSTLLATLRTISSIWKQEQQTQNALEIATRAGALYDKFVGFTQDMESIGTSLDSARKHYTNAFNKLSSGEGNLVRRVEHLEKLGARVKKQIDRKLLDSRD